MARSDTTNRDARRKDSPPATAAASPAQTMQDLLASIDSLILVIAEENRILEASDIRAFQAIQDRKIGCAQKYRQQLSALMERREEIVKTMDPAMRQALERKQKVFEDARRENAGHLERMGKSTQRLSERIKKAVCDVANRNAHSYGARGRLEQGGRRVSLSLNESA